MAAEGSLDNFDPKVIAKTVKENQIIPSFLCDLRALCG
jgi:hypothetical protein